MQLRVVLGLAAIACRPVPKQVRFIVERVLDLGANARLNPFELLHHLTKRAIAELFALARLHRDVPPRAMGSLALVALTIAGISNHVEFEVVKQHA